VREQAGWRVLRHLALDALTRAIPVIATSTDHRVLERAEAKMSS
jgi:hypothetical protein